MIDFALDTLIWTGALIVLALVLRRPVARAFGPGLAYALWLLPLLRLALPPVVLPRGWLPQGFAPVAANPVPAAAGADTVVTTVAVPVETPFALPWELLLGSAWIAGAALFLIVRVLDYRAMRRRLLAGAVEVDRRDGVRLVETRAVDAPVAFGVRDKVVALPPRFLISGSLAERALAVEHELAHHRGRDLLANWLAQPILALHWFNPLAWAAWNAMRRDQEAACDARTLAGRDLATRAAYAQVIASFAAAGRLSHRAALAAPMACPVLGDKSIVHRLRSLTMTDISPRRRRAGRWALALSTALALPLTATVVYAGQDAPPPPPAAPEAPLAPRAPAAPDAPKAIKRVMVIHEDGKPGEHALRPQFERKVERDGKTIIVRTDKELSDAELEAKLAELEARMPKIEALRAGVAIDEADGKRRVVIRQHVTGDGPVGDHEAHRFIMRRGPGDGPGVRAMVLDGADCKDGQEVVADADGGAASGRKERVRVRVCQIGGKRAEAAAGLRDARERIAADSELSDSARARVLEKLDEAIARMEKAGK
jgi:beta-lactamase regulating signal transducer with metallopeptidase domain